MRLRLRPAPDTSFPRGTWGPMSGHSAQGHRLGDKTQMYRLVAAAEASFRPAPSGPRHMFPTHPSFWHRKLLEGNAYSALPRPGREDQFLSAWPPVESPFQTP